MNLVYEDSISSGHLMTDFDKFALTRSMSKCGMKEYPEVIGDEQGYRCSGKMICDACGQKYYDHPLDWRVLGYNDHPYLNILCDGRRVKL